MASQFSSSKILLCLGYSEEAVKAVNSAKVACEDKMNSQDCAGYKDLGMCKSHGECSAVPHAVPPILQCPADSVPHCSPTLHSFARRVSQATSETLAKPHAMPVKTAACDECLCGLNTLSAQIATF